MKQGIIRLCGLAAMMGALTGCDEIKFNGKLNLLEQVTFAQKAGNVTVAPGQFQTKATLGVSGSKKTIKLEIKNADPATTVELKFSKDIAVGETFNIAAAQLGQNFDLAGTMATKVQDSQEYYESQSCSVQYPQTVCRALAKSASDEAREEGLAAQASNLSEFVKASEAPEASNPVMVEEKGIPQQGYVPPPHQPVCHTVWYTRPGWQQVRYFNRTTLRDIDANFVQAGKTLGGFKGASSQTQRIYTYQGPCY